MELACHLILADGCVINYISRFALLDRFIKQLIMACNYSAGYCSDSPSGRLMTIYLDVQTQSPAAPEYSTIGRYFAMSFSEDYSKTIFLIDSKLLTSSHQVLFDIALSIIGTINYVMLVAADRYSPAHCAMIEINGKGALICAPSGTGKSTCASRLPVPHRVLADDCALLIQSGDDFIAQAMPTWSTLGNYIKKNSVQFDCSSSVKLAGIFFLEQSSADAVQVLNNAVAHGYLNSSFNDQTRWLLNHLVIDEAKLLRMKMFSLAEQAIAKLPVYRLCASLDGKFWDVMREVL